MPRLGASPSHNERKGGLEGVLLQETHDDPETTQDLTTSRAQPTVSSTSDSSDWFVTITPLPKVHLAGRLELVTRVITLIDNNSDGILDFVTEIGLSPPRTSTDMVVITTDPIKPQPPTTTSHDESRPFPTATSIILTFVPFPPPSSSGSTLPFTIEPTSSGPIPTTFVTITITSSHTNATPNPTQSSAPVLLPPTGNRTAMGIGIGVAVGAAILAFGAVYCCCGKEKLLANFGKKKNKDKGKGRAVSPGQAEEEGFCGGGGGRRGGVTVSSAQGHEGLMMKRYRTPEEQQGLGICISGVDLPLLSQQPMVNGGFGTGLGYSPALSAGQFSKSDSYSEAYIPTPSVDFQQSVSTPTSKTSNAPLLSHNHPPIPTSGSSRHSSDHIRHLEQTQLHTKQLYTVTSLPRHTNTYSRTSLESARTNNNHSPYTRTMSPKSPVIRVMTPRQPRWTSFSGTGEGDGTGLGRPPVAMEGESESVVMSSVCGNERDIASSQSMVIGVPHGVIEKEQGGWEGERFLDGDRDAAASGVSRGSSKMLDPIRYYNGVPSAFTTGTSSRDDGSHYPSNITELAPVYTFAGFVPMPTSPTSTVQQGSSRSNTPLDQSQQASRKQSATFRPYSILAESPIDVRVPSEPALIPGAERRPSSVTLTLVPLSTRSCLNTAATNSIGPGQGRVSIDSASWTSSLHPPHSRGGSATSSVDPRPSVRTIRRQASQLATEQVTAGVSSPLEGLIRAHLPRGSTYDESYDVESSPLSQSQAHPKRLAVQEWIQSSPSAWGDPEGSNVACGGTELEFGGAEEEEGGQEGKLEVEGWRAAGTLVEGDSVSQVGPNSRF